MSGIDGLYITFCRCNDPAREPVWDEWFDTVRLPQLMHTGGWARATRWRLTVPVASSTDLGFSHMTVLEMDGPDALEKIQRAASSAFVPGLLHSHHAALGALALRPVGRWADTPPLAADAQSLLFISGRCTDPARDAEWNRWYDDVHIPDVLSTGGYHAATRWRLLDPHPAQANDYAIYQSRLQADEAYRTMAEGIPPLYAQGRRHPLHTAGIRFTLEPAGRYGAAGLPRGQALLVKDPSQGGVMQ